MWWWRGVGWERLISEEGEMVENNEGEEYHKISKHYLFFSNYIILCK